MADNQPPAAPAGPPPFVPVLGNVIVPDNINEAQSIVQILRWIGFREAAARDSLIDDCFGSFADVQSLTERDITTMASDFSSRTAAAGRIYFGTNRTKKLKALVHWANDFQRCSREPTIIGLNEVTFKNELDIASQRAIVRKNMEKKANTHTEAADPGPLKSEKQWKEWEEKLVNYLRCQLGAFGVPLSYVIRGSDEPEVADADAYPDFLTRTAAQCSLSGEYYNADKLTVFNLLVSFTTGQPSGDWIKSTLKYSDGRRSMKALRNHFSGEGNATRTIAEAERLRETLHYKSERAMAFETFLTQMQKMFNIYEKENEPMTEDQKVRLLYSKVQCKDLQLAVNALEALKTTGTNITYTTAANHLSTAVSKLPEYIAKNRNVSAITTSAGGSSIYDESGNIITGFIPNWQSISKADRAKVIAERKRLGIQKAGNGGTSKGRSNASEENTIKQLKLQNAKQKRKIKALRKKVSFKDDTDDNEEEEKDAGDEFGGRNQKKKGKKND